VDWAIAPYPPRMSTSKDTWFGGRPDFINPFARDSASEMRVVQRTQSPCEHKGHARRERDRTQEGATRPPSKGPKIDPKPGPRERSERPAPVRLPAQVGHERAARDVDMANMRDSPREAPR